MQRYKRILLVVLPILVLLIGTGAYAAINLTAQKPAQHSSLKPAINLDQGQKGLVGWWKLNGNAKDSTPYQDNGTIEGSVTPTADRKGTPNGAMAFNGVGANRIIVPNSTAVKPPQTITASAWVEPNDMAAASVQKLVSTTEAGGYALEIVGSTTDAACTINTLCFQLNISGQGYKAAHIDRSGLPQGQWSLVTGTYDGSSVKLYVNGALVATTTATGAINEVTTPLCLGAEATPATCAGGGNLNGSLSDVRLYNRALSAGEIQTLYNSYNSQVNACTASCTVNLSAGLIGSWPFNGNANDATPYQDNGTLSSPPPTLTTDRFGKPNSAYGFNGTNNYIDFGSSSVLNPPQAISISSWIKPTANGFRTNYISREQSYRQIYFNDNKLYFQLGFQDGSWAANWISSTATIPLNTWTNVVTVFDGSSGSTRAKIYINGVLDKQGSVSGNTLKIFSADLTVGAAPANDGYFQGSIDDVRIYNRPLSAAEVQALYNLPD